jgi:hypothetical protein
MDESTPHTVPVSDPPQRDRRRPRDEGNDDVPEPVALHTEFTQAIILARVQQRDMYVVIIHAIRYLLKQRQYQTTIPLTAMLKRTRAIELPRTNPYNLNPIPKYGLMRTGYDGCTGIEQLLGLESYPHHMRTVAQYMTVLDMQGEITIFKCGRNIYYHLIQGSGLDLVRLPSFAAMVEFINGRDVDSTNPFRTPPRKRGRPYKVKVDVDLTEETYGNVPQEIALPPLPTTPKEEWTTVLDDMARNGMVEPIPEEFRYLPRVEEEDIDFHFN